MFWEKTLFEAVSPINGKIKVSEQNGKRKLTVDGYTQSVSLNRDGLTGKHYWDIFTDGSIRLDQDSRVLVLGLGGGTIPKILTRKFGLVLIDGVEIDPLIVEIAKNYFGLNEPNVNIFTEDAAKFVKNAKYKYDLICVDIYNGGEMASICSDRSFFEDCKKIMSEKGVLGVNKIISSSYDLKNYLDFLRGFFKSVQYFVDTKNLNHTNAIIYCRS